LSNVLFGVSPVDAVGIGIAVSFVLGVGLVAGLLPARRAAHVDPMRVLHYE
jgi:ABC-type antimicrobial peptide transport system permease subunit